MARMVQYRARCGKMQWKPFYADLADMAAEQEGFCVACGERQEGCEPDARRYKCSHCGQPKVYGAEELLMMGLYQMGK